MIVFLTQAYKYAVCTHGKLRLGIYIYAYHGQRVKAHSRPCEESE